MKKSLIEQINGMLKDEPDIGLIHLIYTLLQKEQAQREGAVLDG